MGYKSVKWQKWVIRNVNKGKRNGEMDCVMIRKRNRRVVGKV